MKATASIYLDPRKKTSGECPVKLKITFNRKRKYFSTGIDLKEEEFEQVMFGKRLNVEQRSVRAKLDAFKTKADKVIESIRIFTFSQFEEAFFENRDVNSDVSYAFERKIAELKEDDKVGTAVTYECAKKSIMEFKPNLTFAEITPKLLKEYESSMLKQDRSSTTISMYLRSLRAIYNAQNIDRALYPFGRGKSKYTIPKSANTKKALSLEEVAKIFNYKPANEAEERARDYWIFLYLCNGMNVKDLCLLKWNDIQDDFIIYDRAKTSSTKSGSNKIQIALKSESKEIIRRWGIQSLDRSSFIFPHLKKEMTAEKQRKVYQQLTKTINKYIRRIASKLEIPHHVTTYSARHSFATVLKRSGADIAMISELLGHSDLKVTQSYLDSFEDDQIQAQTEVLTVGFKVAE